MKWHWRWRWKEAMRERERERGPYGTEIHRVPGAGIRDGRYIAH